MRGGLLLCVLLVALLGLAVAQKINEAELNNDALSRKRINCLLDRGPCDKTGNLLKAAAPEAIGKNCKKCNAQQRAAVQRLLAVGKQKYPNELAQIRAKYSTRAG